MRFAHWRKVADPSCKMDLRGAGGGLSTASTTNSRPGSLFWWLTLTSPWQKENIFRWQSLHELWFSGCENMRMSWFWIDTVFAMINVKKTMICWGQEPWSLKKKLRCCEELSAMQVAWWPCNCQTHMREWSGMGFWCRHAHFGALYGVALEIKQQLKSKSHWPRLEFCCASLSYACWPREIGR